MRGYIIAFAVSMLLILSGYIYVNMLVQKNREIERISKNLIELRTDNEIRQTQNGKLMLQIKELEVTSEELVKLRLIDQSTIKDLDIKLKRLKKITSTGTGTVIDIEPIVKDSFIYIEGKPDSCKYIAFKDNYADISGMVCNTAKLHIEITDTIVSFAHVIPHKFLFFKFGVKEIKQEVYSKSPYSKIYFSNSIQIKN